MNLRHITASNLIIIIAIGVVYATFSFFTPPQFDDFMFLADFVEHNNGSSTFSWDGFFANAQYLRDTDNSRLPNILWPIYGIAFPKWVLSIILGCSMALTIFFGARIASERQETTPFVITIFWGLTILFLPWRGNMIIGVFASNYFLSSAITLFFIYALYKSFEHHPSLLSAAGLLLTGLIAGATHEGFSVPVLIGIGLFAIIKKFKLPLIWWGMSLTYLIGILFLLSADGMWMRLDHIDQFTASQWDLKIHSQNLFAFWVLLIWSIAAMLKKGWRNWFFTRFHNPAFTICYAASFVAFALAYRTGIGNLRALWAVELFSLICLVNMGQKWIQIPGRKTRRMLSVAGLIAIIIFYCQVIYYQRSLHTQYDKIVMAMHDSDTGTAYFDYNIIVPKTTLLHPVYDTWWNHCTLNQLNRQAPENKIYSVVPLAMKNLTIPVDSLTTIPGSAKACRFGDYAIMRDYQLTTPDLMDEPFEIVANIFNVSYRNASGETFDDMPSVLYYFIAPTGEKLIFIQPLHVKVKGPYTHIDIS